MHTPAIYRWLLPLLCLLPLGCEVDYYAHLVAGELGRLAVIVPIDTAIGDPALTEAEKQKLRQVKEIRAFGITQVGLYAGDAYTVFEANGVEPVAFALSASAKDSLTPYEWLLPFAGIIQQKVYLDRALGQREADWLTALGYDVFYAEVDGYSTLGFLPDPVRQSTLRRDDIDLAELILHEMTHSTIYKPSDTNYNESVATFLGRAAAQAWLEATYGRDSEEAAEASTRFADKGVVDEYVGDVFDQASAYYHNSRANGLPLDQIIAGREAVFQQMAEVYVAEFEPRLGDAERWAVFRGSGWDNARILAGVRYRGNLSDFADVLESVAGDLPRAIEVYREAAGQADSREYLRSWVVAQ